MTSVTTELPECRTIYGKMERTEALRRVLFLKGLPSETIAEVAAAGHIRGMDRDEALFWEGDRCLGLIVVLVGAVKTFKLDARGREMILGFARPGESVGELALFDGGNYPVNAASSEDGTRLLIVPPHNFSPLLARHPEIAVGAMRALAIQQRKLIEMLKVQTLHTVRSRIAAYLLNVAGEETVFPLRETNAVIGSVVGTVREVVSRTLHALEDEGAIHLRGRTVTVLRPDILRRISQSE